MDELYNKLRPLLLSRRPKVAELHIVRYEVAQAKADALQTLYELRIKRLRPKDKEWTDLDRKIEVLKQRETTHSYVICTR